MPVRIPFNGGSLILSEAYEFKSDKTGEMVKLEACVIVSGVTNKPIRIPLDAIDTIITLGSNPDYKEFAKASRQRKH